MLLKIILSLKKLCQYIVTILALKKGILNIDSKFDLQQPTAGGINKIIKSLDTNKATGPNGIPAKFVQMSANGIDCHLSNIIA